MKYRIQYLIVALALATLLLGVALLSACQREPQVVVPLAANFSNPVDIEGSSSAAAPALTFEDDTDTGLFRSAANTLNIASGGSEVLEIDSAGFTIAGSALDVDSSIDFDGTSVDLTASSSIVLSTTEAAADAIHLDANEEVTTGIDIDLGSVSGMSIDGGLVDIGGGSYTEADGDDDLGIAGDLEVDGDAYIDTDLEVGDDLDLAGDLRLAGDLEASGDAYFYGALVTPFDDLTEAITLTVESCGAIYFLNSATEFEVILPDVDEAEEGCTLQFIVKAAPDGASYTIITGNSKENVLIGGINELEVDTEDDGPYDDDADTITFVNGTAVVGDYVYMISDGTSWYLRGQANADGGITLTQAD